MISSAIVPKDLEITIQRITLEILGIDPNASGAYGLVRIGWPQEGQPGWGTVDDIAFIRVVEVDDDYNKIQDRTYIDSGQDLSEIGSYTRVWEVFWVFYGPNSFDRARLVKTMLMKDDVTDQLEALNIYLIPDLPAPMRAPEPYAGQWWERVDFSARFNEQVDETDDQNAVKTVEVIVSDSVGEVADFVVGALLSHVVGYIVDHTLATVTVSNNPEQFTIGQDVILNINYIDQNGGAASVVNQHFILARIDGNNLVFGIPDSGQSFVASNVTGTAIPSEVTNG